VHQLRELRATRAVSFVYASLIGTLSSCGGGTKLAAQHDSDAAVSDPNHHDAGGSDEMPAHDAGMKPGKSDAGEQPDAGEPPPVPVDCGAFAHARILTLDTSSAGADVSDDVLAFPLALTLSQDNFDFSQAKPDGSDVRFLADDGSALPYSIERWDADKKEAALWVRLAKIRGHEQTRLTMQWGKADAQSQSDSHAVFAASDGFVGVWHLAEEGSEESGHYKDATEHGADATGVNLAGEASISGRIGPAARLEHDKTQWIRVDGDDKNALFDLYEKMSYSVWIYALSHSVDYQCAFSKGETGFRMHFYGSNEWDDNKGKHITEACVEQVGGEDLCPLKGGEMPWLGTDVKLGQWWHWTVVQDYPSIRIYLNGTLEVENTDGGDWTSGAKAPVGIGNNTTWSDGRRSWDGYVDEARVLNEPKSAAWVKLDYESQREGQKLVIWGETKSCK
jgi:hypothetical protein